MLGAKFHVGQQVTLRGWYRKDYTVTITAVTDQRPESHAPDCKCGFFYLIQPESGVTLIHAPEEGDWFGEPWFTTPSTEETEHV